jgi:hypothetical protein
MAWQSFGATVLLALVALIELASSEPVHENRERLEHLAQQVNAMLEEILGSGQFAISTANGHESWTAMIDLWQKDETKCGHGFFSELRRWALWADKTTKSDLSNAIIETWEETCYTRLEEKIQSELNTMNKSTREHFELFAMQDQHECKSRTGCLSFHTSNLAIGGLRRLIGWPEGAPSADQLEAAERSVSACKEMTASDSIKTTRTQYLKWTPSSPEPHFPHIRFYDYCKELLEIDSRLELDPGVRRFGEELDKIRACGLSKVESDKMSSESEQKRLVAKAAVRFAKGYKQLYFHKGDAAVLGRDHNVQWNDLKISCSIMLDRAANIVWMHQHIYQLLRREGLDQRTPETERNLRYLKACRQLGELENKEIIEMTKKSHKAFTLIERCFGHSSD